MPGYNQCPSCNSPWVERSVIFDDPPTFRTGDSVDISNVPGRVEVACSTGHRFGVAEETWSVDRGTVYNGLSPIV